MAVAADIRPFIVTFYDPKDKAAISRYLFAGDIGKDVAAALNTFPRSERANKILERYFGGEYGLTDMTPAKPGAEGRDIEELGLIDTAGKYEGGGPAFAGVTSGKRSGWRRTHPSAMEQMEFGDLTAFDEMDDDHRPPGDESGFGDHPASQDQGAATAPGGVGLGERRALYTIDDNTGVPFSVCKESVYTFDSLRDMKNKIFVASGVPTYRQHIFYMSPIDLSLKSLYRISVEETALSTDPRAIFEHGSAMDYIRLAGLPIDRHMEERRGDIRIDLFDSYMHVPKGLHQVYVVDMMSVLGYSDDTMRDVVAAIEDEFQADLLYYGLVLKYWPELSINAFKTMITKPADMPAKYPRLAPALAHATAVAAKERELVARLSLQKPGDEVSYAITRAVLSAGYTRTWVDIRNVFDWIEVTPLVPAALVKFMPKNTGFRRDVTVTKRHTISFNDRYTGAIGQFFAQNILHPCVVFFVVKMVPEGRGAVEFAEVTIYTDGRYTIETDWREGDRVTYEQAKSDVARLSRPLIDRINDMAGAAFPLGGSLKTPDIGTISIDKMTISGFWHHAITAGAFKDVKAGWRDYEQAGIVSIMGLQQGGAYSFMFKKGIVDNDRMMYERYVRTSYIDEESPVNTYGYLTDQTQYARWEQIHAGRGVKIFYRTADLKVEIVNVSISEFTLIQRFIFSYLNGFVPKNGAVIVDDQDGASRLKRLQERDPDLYDLKKYDTNAVVYSVLCQSKYQPIIYSEDEYNRMGATRRKSMVRYWNFTERRPAYYECPTRGLQYMGFKVGKHLMGYCLPCCDVTEAAPGSRTGERNRICIERHTWGPDDDTDSDQKARHVLLYGKVIPPKRIGEVHRDVDQGVLYNTIQPPNAYRLVGVQQSVRTVPDAGLYFAVAAALAMKPKDFGLMITSFMARIKNYMVLGNGAGGYFPSAKAMADEFVNVFINNTPEITSFTPGGVNDHAWRAIFVDVIRSVLQLEVVVFSETRGRALHALISHGAAMGMRAGHGLIVVFRAGGVYPMFIINQRMYSRVTKKEMSVRRIYTRTAEDALNVAKTIAIVSPRKVNTSLLTNGSPDNSELPPPATLDYLGVADQVVDSILKMYDSQAVAPSEYLRQQDLKLVGDFLEQSKRYTVHMTLINAHNECYGLIIKDGGGTAPSQNFIYIPVTNSPYITPGVARAAMHYGPRPTALPMPHSALMGCVLALNKYIHDNDDIRAKFSTIKPMFMLADKATHKHIGFISKTAPDSYGLWYYHDPEEPTEGAKSIVMQYDNLDIDEKIYTHGPASSDIDLPEIWPNGGAQQYKNYLYRLFMLEFAAMVRDERDEKIRGEISQSISDTDFKSVRSVAKLTRSLRALLKEYPSDLIILHDMLTACGARDEDGDIKKDLPVMIAGARFEFDNLTLRRMMSIDGADLHSSLDNFMRKAITQPMAIDDTDTGANAPTVDNIYVACSTTTTLGQAQCTRGKLSMTEKKFGELVDILAADIRNPLKHNAMTFTISGVIDEMRFIERSNEHLTFVR